MSFSPAAAFWALLQNKHDSNIIKRNSVNASDKKTLYTRDSLRILSRDIFGNENNYSTQGKTVQSNYRAAFPV